MYPGQPTTCDYCGAEMGPVRRSILRHCGKLACMSEDARTASARLAAELDETAARRRKRFREARPDLLERVAQEAGCAPEQVRIEPMPHYPPNMVPLDEERRATFLAHLDEVLAQAFATTPEEAAREYPPHPVDPGEPPQATPACATCRGFCCRPGGKHNAFLTLAVIQGFRVADPDIGADTLRDRYEERLSDSIAEGGCVFAGPEGCTLERSWRAPICNRFHCGTLSRSLDRMKADPPEGPVVFPGFTEGGGMGVVSVMEQDGSWRELEE
ncbi:hypothetical protein [Vannielia litorea]|uniref:Uncharacterized protein n=1 Tax=Vannielia litorea TaxID=1217970 RepID=A0A1N6FJB5_9RHOB|nr:hypothetical protein [Vannielia litorea]SIN95334.1 hypothetical protein SAMN05444002_1714 [Vannielia litorea]